MADLKLCPFCTTAHKPFIAKNGDGDSFVKCSWCDAGGPVHLMEADAIEAWNRRAAPADKQGGGLTLDAIKLRVVAVRLYSAGDQEGGEYLAGLADRLEQSGTLARVAPSVPERWTIHQQTTGDWVLRNEGSGDGALCFHDDESPLAEVVRQLCQSLAAAPQPSEKQVEPESPMKVAADALRRKAELEQAHQDGYRDGFKAAQAMLDKAEQPAEEARGVVTFEEWRSGEWDLGRDPTAKEAWAAAMRVNSEVRRLLAEARDTIIQCTTVADPGTANAFIAQIDAALLAAPAAATTQTVPVELIGVADARKRGGGFWTPCTGCYDTEDGRPTRKYAHSVVLGCELGDGCSECGGIGAVWDDTDYAAMAEFMARKDDDAQAAPSAAATGSGDAEQRQAAFEIRVGGNMEAGTSGQRAEALQSAMQYFFQYAADATEDEPVELVEVVHLATATQPHGGKERG